MKAEAFAKMKIPFVTAGAISLLLVTVLSGRDAQLTAAERRDALRILRFLDQVEVSASAKKTAPAARLDFTESEFNAYVAYRIAAEKDPVMNELRLKLFDQNRIEGKIGIDLRGQNLPAVLKPQMNLYFEGVFETREGRIRLDFRQIYLDGQRIPSLVLDMIIFIASKLGKADAGSVHDWYELPPGIKDLKTAAGQVSVFY